MSKFNFRIILFYKKYKIKEIIEAEMIPSTIISNDFRKSLLIYSCSSMEVTI